MEKFGIRHLSTLKSGEAVKRELNRHVVAIWGDRDIHDIAKRDVIDLLDEIADSGRVVTDEETKWFWAACTQEGQPWGHLGKMLLFTGQRLGEVVNMTDSEVDGDVWRMAGNRTKNGRTHDVPLSEAARDALSVVVRVNGDAIEIPHWTFHDLRRTAATAMARMGIPVGVTEAALNHVSGTGGGIVGVGPVAELCSSFNCVLCAKGETGWHHNIQQNSDRKQSGSVAP